ncbi:hypothetical protein MLD38_020280 [Melastoma candidum]|uniref:Uncharacterized protein n=1 Tax=Melastoma candidum TaxID=119954 RepID=A0ACB9QCL7_9MYRT|nr:hypothetical protein MLD38_020280 [Melastoma candidum]
MSVQEELVACGSDSMHSPHLSQVESAKDSNSFPDEADTAASGFAEVGWGHGHAMGKDRASTSSAKWHACDYLQEMADVSDAEKGLISEISGRRFNSFFSSRGENPHDCGLQMRQMLEEKLLEFGVGLALGCPEYANECQGQLANNEAEGSSYMLSGKSRVTEEPLTGPKKPTIDQEFEEYFSTLMM